MVPLHEHLAVTGTGPRRDIPPGSAILGECRAGVRRGEGGEVQHDAGPGRFGAGVPASTGPFDIVVIGASFGGPKAIETILTALPWRFPLPIVVCQHITPGMTAMWAERLDRACHLSVAEASDRELLAPRMVRIAPVGVQMRVVRGPLGPHVRLDADFADSLHVPAIDVLFSSAAAAFGPGALGVLLTGLGSDGASGSVQIRQAGGMMLGEASSTAASYSMPGAAASAGGIVEELPVGEIAPRLIELAATSSGR